MCNEPCPQGFKHAFEFCGQQHKTTECLDKPVGSQGEQRQRQEGLERENEAVTGSRESDRGAKAVLGAPGDAASAV